MPLPETPDTGLRARYWTRDEYHRAADSGVFGPEERLELICGEIVAKMPQKSLHAAGIRLASDARASLFGRSHDVRPPLPLALSEDSEPEPDVLVAVGAARDYVDHHPTPAEVVLVVEISDTTLTTDRGSKGALYAQYGIAEYWLMNLNTRQLEVYRDPLLMPGSPFGYGYISITLYAEQDAVAPLAAPESSVAVADRMPPFKAASSSSAETRKRTRKK